MPRYFFHVDNGHFAPDPVGLELPNLRAARIEAVQAAGTMISEAGEGFWEHREPFNMHVVDSDDRLLFTLEFSAKVPTGDARYIPEIVRDGFFGDGT